jgi:hypothetical protein
MRAVVAGTGKVQTALKVEAALVERFVCGVFQPLDLVPDHQFSALQLDYVEVVRGKVHQSLVQFAFQHSMFPFQFNEMRLNCHA